MASEFWQRLRQARRYADMTQQDLAERCEVTRGAVALWEASEPEHRTKPTTEHCITVAKTCGVPLEWLLNDSSDLDSIWRLSEFGGKTPTQSDVLPDLRQGDHLFLFAATPEQVASKVKHLAGLPSAQRSLAHLILIGLPATVETVATPADALAAVVRKLTQS